MVGVLELGVPLSGLVHSKGSKANSTTGRGTVAITCKLQSTRECGQGPLHSKDRCVSEVFPSTWKPYTTLLNSAEDSVNQLWLLEVCIAVSLVMVDQLPIWRNPAASNKQLESLAKSDPPSPLQFLQAPFTFTMYQLMRFRPTRHCICHPHHNVVIICRNKQAVRMLEFRSTQFVLPYRPVNTTASSFHVNMKFRRSSIDWKSGETDADNQVTESQIVVVLKSRRLFTFQLPAS